MNISIFVCQKSQRARGKLIQEVRESFTVDAFVGNATDWEKVCIGNLVGMPVMVVPVGFKKIQYPPTNETRRRSTVTTGIYAPPDHDHIVSCLGTLRFSFKFRFVNISKWDPTLSQKTKMVFDVL